jgi:hypothetical protein
MTDLLDEVEQRHRQHRKHTKETKETLAGRISRLGNSGKIPEEIDILIRAAVEIRNLAEYNSGFVPLRAVADVLRAITIAIGEWAMAQRSAYAAELEDWKPLT